MSIDEKIDYNKKQSRKYGWKAKDFGASGFNASLIEAIKKFQLAHDLLVDGLCGPNTYRRLMLQVDDDDITEDIEETKSENFILYKGEKYKIFWNKVKQWDEKGGHEARRGTYRKSTRTPQMFVAHWDVCRKSSDTIKVLNKRGLSVHALIDADSYIYMCMPLENIAYHAGSGFNSISCGVEICNPYYTKYRSADTKRGLSPRPIENHTMVHGKKLKPHLGFHVKQIDALAALFEAISFACDIPLQIPKTRSTVDEDVAKKRFAGLCGHFHITKRKIDPASINFDHVLRRAKKIRERRNQ